MSLLRAIDETIEVRKLIHKLGEELEKLDIAENTRADLLEGYYQAWDMINSAVAHLEESVVPSGLKVAISFMPDLDRAGAVAEEVQHYSLPRRGGDPRGTLMLPSDPPE